MKPGAFPVLKPAIGWVVGLILYALVGCGLNEFKRQEQKLLPLVERRASKEELISLLGADFLMYSKGQPSWDALTQFLAREPNRNVAVRNGAAKWPNVMLYSTPDMMTWVFLDQDEKVVDLVIGAQ
jgi:hypothetical protein